MSRECSGYVYVLDVWPGQALYKVGWTENLKQRLANHRRTYPYLQVLFTAPSSQGDDETNRDDFFNRAHGLRMSHSIDICVCCPELVPAAIEHMAWKLEAR